MTCINIPEALRVVAGLGAIVLCFALLFWYAQWSGKGMD